MISYIMIYNYYDTITYLFAYGCYAQGHIIISCYIYLDIVNLKHEQYNVDEGKYIWLELFLSRALQSTITVQLEYTHVSPATSK